MRLGRERWEKMIAVSRRLFLASSAAAAASPTFGMPASSGTDVIVVGAGAAGIAAARRIAAEGRKLAVFEATDRIGGRSGERAAEEALKRIASFG